jgi:hypothetical protein
MILWWLFWRYGDEFGKNKRGFCSVQAHIQKPPPVFTQTYYIGRNEDSTGPYFSEIQEAKKSKDRWEKEQFKGTYHPQIPSK